MNIKKLKNFAKNIRKNIIFTAYKAGAKSAHIGGALSIVDIMSVLYGHLLKINLKKPADRFILSKGHGFLGLLSALYCKKYIIDVLRGYKNRYKIKITTHFCSKRQKGYCR